MKVDESVITRARHAAVDEHKSVSAWVQDVIKQELDARYLYERNRKGALMVLNIFMTSIM